MRILFYLFHLVIFSTDCGLRDFFGLNDSDQLSFIDCNGKNLIDFIKNDGRKEVEDHLEKIDWSFLSKKDQQILLRTIQKRGELKKLTFNNSSVFDADGSIEKFKNINEVRSLSFIGVQGIDYQLPMKLHQLNIRSKLMLTELTLSNISTLRNFYRWHWFTENKPIILPSGLKRLKISSCSNLIEIDVKGDALEEVRLSDNSSLINTSIDSLEIKKLEVENCPRFNPLSFDEFIRSSLDKKLFLLALKYIQVILKNLELVDDWIDVVFLYKQASATYEGLDNPHKALEYAIKALELTRASTYYEEVEDFTFLSSLYTIVSHHYEKSQDFPHALEYAKQALSINEQVLLDSCGQPAIIVPYLDDLSAKDESIDRKILSAANNPELNISTYLYNIGKIYTKLGDLESSIRYLTPALSIQKKAFGYEHSETKKTQQLIDELLH